MIYMICRLVCWLACRLGQVGQEFARSQDTVILALAEDVLYKLLPRDTPNRELANLRRVDQRNAVTSANGLQDQGFVKSLLPHLSFIVQIAKQTYSSTCPKGPKFASPSITF
jgi:hypothetical protein